MRLCWREFVAQALADMTGVLPHSFHAILDFF